MSDELASDGALENHQEGQGHQDLMGDRELMGDEDELGPDGLDGEGKDAAGGIRVILADSQAIYRVGMRKVFALEDDIRVVAQAETLDNLYAALQHFPTDVVLLEAQLITGL